MYGLGQGRLSGNTPTRFRSISITGPSGGRAAGLLCATTRHSVGPAHCRSQTGSVSQFENDIGEPRISVRPNPKSRAEFQSALRLWGSQPTPVRCESKNESSGPTRMYHPASPA